MWSVWPETVDVYLSRGLALVKASGRTVTAVRSPLTVPLASNLEKLRAELATVRFGQQYVRRRIRIALSAGFCPAIGFAVPSGLTQVMELYEVARAAAAAQFGVQQDQLACEVDLTRPGVVAVLPRTLVQALHEWSTQVQGRLLSIQPLWSIASKCGAARRRVVKGLWLEEPDSLTLLAPNAKNQVIARTLTRSAKPDLAQAQAKDWLHQQSVAEAQILKVAFKTDPRQSMVGQPTVWPAHWKPL